MQDQIGQENVDAGKMPENMNGTIGNTIVNESSTNKVEHVTDYSMPIEQKENSENALKKNKFSFWEIFFAVLCALQLILIVYSINFLRSSKGEPGSEFAGLLFFLFLFPFIVITSNINLIGIPIVVIKYKTRSYLLGFYILSLAAPYIFLIFYAFL